jgi:hypothetical protein
VVVAAARGDAGHRELELIDRIGDETDVDVAAVVVNRVLPELFGRGEEEIFERLREPDAEVALAGAAGGGPRPCSTPPSWRSPCAAAGPATSPASARVDPTGCRVLYVPYLFTRTHGCGPPPGRRVARRRAGVLMARSRRGPARRSSSCCAAKEIVVSCGAGGVGKTTTAAALAAMAAAHLGGRSWCSPSTPPAAWPTPWAWSVRQRRDAGACPRPSPPRGSSPAASCGRPCSTPSSPGTTWCTARARRETRDAILANPLYQNITGKFVQSHDYIAMERLYEIHASGRYDLIVVDTPPTRNAIDFLDAPERMADFFSAGCCGWLIAPYRSRLVGFASKPFYSVADRILGTQFLEDIAEFFILFQSMYDGFVERARAVTRVLEDRRTTFVVVSTLESAPLREAEFFIDAIGQKRLHLGGLVLNKVLPDYLRDKDRSGAGPPHRGRLRP